MLNKSYIRLNTLLYAILILIIKKSNDDLYIYIDYRILNILTIKNHNILSLIRKTLLKLYIVKIYSKFDIIVIFNKIRIKEDEKKKTTFLTRYNLFEYIVISFKLYNVLSIFQTFINKILREYLDIFYFAYLDDILIYSNIKKEYVKYIRKILEKLNNVDLYLNINKC